MNTDWGDEFGDYLADALTDAKFRRHYSKARNRGPIRRALKRLWDRRPFLPRRSK